MADAPAAGREPGLELAVVRDAGATVSHMLWAPYAFTRANQVFGTGAADDAR